MRTDILDVTRDLNRTGRFLFAVVPATLFILGCDVAADTESERGAALCEDGIDNDGDGARDCQDAECAKFCDEATDTDTTFHVFLLLGQSNMEGAHRARSEDQVEDERILVLGYDDCEQTGRELDEWDIATPPLHTCDIGALGPGDYFSRTLVEVVPEGDTIGLVPCARNGSPIEPFMKGGSHYHWIVRRAELAQEAGGIIEGMIFHQGESNCEEESWPEKVSQMVEDLRADLGIGEVPFLAGELLYSGDCSAHNPLVNQLPDVIDNAYVVSAEGLEVKPVDDWNLHFSRDAQATLGQRYGEKMIEALGW